MGEVPIKHVEYRVITDPNSAVLSLESGDIDAYVDVQQTSFKRIQEKDVYKRQSLCISLGHCIDDRLGGRKIHIRNPEGNQILPSELLFSFIVFYGVTVPPVCHHIKLALILCSRL